MKAVTEKINPDRIGVIIGSDGVTKKEIEKETNTEIHVDSKKNEASITSPEENAYDVYRAQLIINAINAGFNEKKALLLSDDDQYLTIIDLRDYASKGKELERLTSRLIGSEGKIRQELERLTKATISVYEGQASIIGNSENTYNAQKAIEMLINGSPAKKVYAYLERVKKEEREKTVQI